MKTTLIKYHYRLGNTCFRIYELDAELNSYPLCRTCSRCRNLEPCSAETLLFQFISLMGIHHQVYQNIRICWYRQHCLRTYF